MYYPFCYQKHKSRFYTQPLGRTHLSQVKLILEQLLCFWSQIGNYYLTRKSFFVRYLV